ncbi:MAG: ketoacyl-ACP synthase III, partial [Gammaproteobacteria bacterium]
LAADKTMKYAVVVGVYNMPAFFNKGDAFAYSIFADGAGAVVLERTEDDDESGYITGQQMTEGTQWDYIGIYTGGAKNPFTQERLDNAEMGLQLLKPLPGSRNIELWPPIVEHLLEKADITTKDVDHILFTQINLSVIKEVMKILDLPMEKTTTVMDKYGYTGSGCIPMALHHAIIESKIKKGDTVAFIASGAGLSVGCNLLKF